MQLDTPIPRLRLVETIPMQHEGNQYIVLRDPQGFSDSMIAVAPEALPILAMFDGQRSASEIGKEISEITGNLFNPEQITAMVDVLDNAHLLDNRTFIEHRLQVEEAFKKQQTREASLAGGGYPEKPDDLRVFLDDLLSTDPPVDFEPEKLNNSASLSGILLPHIDYHRGGKSYGRTYKTFLQHLPHEEEGPLLVGVIGVAHQGALSPIVACDKDFETPLGPLSVDKDSIAVLREKLGDAPFREEWVHKAEHSVELQAVWLKHLLGERQIAFLPLLAGLFENPDHGANGSGVSVAECLQALRMIEEKHHGPVIWIASVDFAHVGPQFGDESVVDDELIRHVEERDMEALNAIRACDAEAWWASVMEDDNARRVCGLNATYLILELLKGSKGVVLDYDKALSPDRQLMVSFAAALFQR